MSSPKLKQLLAAINLKRLNPLKWKWHDHEEVVKNILILMIFAFILLVGSVSVEHFMVPSADQQFAQILKEEGMKTGKHNCIAVGKGSICW
jgi:hypothetical protein